MENHELHKYVRLPSGLQFSVQAEWFTGRPPETPLHRVLGIEERELKPFTRALIGAEDELIHRELDSVRDAFTAYEQFQDLLVIELTEGDPLEGRHYCYYESLVYLRESVVSFLDGNLLAAFALWRPFLEHAVLHGYWELRTAQNGYSEYYKWLTEGGPKPSFRNALIGLCDMLSEWRPVDSGRLCFLRDCLQQFYGSACSYVHTPLPSETTVALSGGIGGVSWDGLFSYPVTLSLVLRQLIYLYILIYPMILYPVEVEQLFGFNGPFGYFADPRNLAYVERFLGARNVATLTKQLEATEDVQQALEQLEKQSPMEAAEIERSWEEARTRGGLEVETDHWGARLSVHKAKCRALNWALNYVPFREQEEVPIDEYTLQQLRRLLEDWSTE